MFHGLVPSRALQHQKYIGTRVEHFAVAHSNNRGMNVVTPGVRIDMVKHSCQYYLIGLALRAIRDWHFILGKLALEMKLVKTIGG